MGATTHGEGPLLVWQEEGEEVDGCLVSQRSHPVSLGLAPATHPGGLSLGLHAFVQVSVQGGQGLGPRAGGGRPIAC